MVAPIVNEKSTAYLTVTCKDKAGAQAAPSALSYRIDCLTTGQVLLEDTALAAAAEVEITLTPAQNAILGGNQQERRRVTVQATYGAADAVNAEFEYVVRNLGGVS